MSTSWEWQALVQQRVIGETKRKSLMLVLAAAADEEGHSFWGVERLASCLEMSRQTVGKMLTEMETRGLLKRERRRSHGRLGVYDMWLQWNAIHDLPITDWQSKRVAVTRESQSFPSGDEPDGSRESQSFRGLGKARVSVDQGKPEFPSVTPECEQPVPNSISSPPATAAETPVKATDDPVKRSAHALTVLAFEQTPKPVLAVNGHGSPFAAVMGIFESVLRSGRSVQEIDRCVRGGVDVWSIGGVTTAIARARHSGGVNGHRLDAKEAMIERIKADGRPMR